MARTRVTNLQEAVLSETPDFLDPYSYRTAAMQKGLNYEREVKDYLTETFCGEVDIFLGPWIKYVEAPDYRWRYAQPDVVMLNEHNPYYPFLVIGEVKLTWKPGAVRKLNNLYEPLCRKVWPNIPVKKVQICKGIKKNCKVEEWHQLKDILSPDKPDYFDVHWF